MQISGETNSHKLPEYWRKKSFRDPLYGFIGVTERELKIIDSVPFQRLRLLKQLSHAYLLYPSAMHVRFEHSLGAMYVSDRMCTSLSVPDRERELARLVVLCHDMGHGPFSHLFEKPLQVLNGDDFSHEIITSWILKDDTVILDALNEFADEAQTLLPVYSGRTEYPLLREIVSSGLDADKLDYLRRDSYHVGVAYGSFDLDRILHTLSSTAEGNLCVLEKGKDAVENYRLGRYLMHAQVYEHHTRLATDGMFLRAFELAIRDGTVDKNSLRIGSRKNSYNRANHSNFLKYYLTLNDETITQQLLRGRGNAKRLINDLCSRKLLKSAIELNTDLDVFDALKKKNISELDKADMTKLEEEVAKQVHCDPDLIIAHLQQMTIKLYDRYDVLVKRRDESILALEDVSPISASVKPIVKLFVFCPEQYREKVRSATYGYFSLSPVNNSAR